MLTAAMVKKLFAVEAGRRLTRDLAEADCERMAPPAFADHVQKAFKELNSPHIQLEVISDTKLLEKEVRSHVRFEGPVLSLSRSTLC